MAKTKNTHVDGAALEAARKRAGFSTTELAALLHIDERTWRRWVKAGSLPTVSLPAVAQYLRLELPGDGRAERDGDGPAGPGRGLLEELQAGVEQVIELQMETLSRVSRLEASLGQRESRQPNRRARQP